MAEHYLRINVAAITSPGRPAGCLPIQGDLAGSLEDQPIVDFLSDSRAGGEARITQ